VRFDDHCQGSVHSLLGKLFLPLVERTVAHPNSRRVYAVLISRLSFIFMTILIALL
jgi:hypothetical protein